MNLSRSVVDGRPNASEPRNSAATLILFPFRTTTCSIRQTFGSCPWRHSHQRNQFEAGFSRNEQDQHQQQSAPTLLVSVRVCVFGET